jgi:hypothetical protein
MGSGVTTTCKKISIPLPKPFRGGKQEEKGIPLTVIDPLQKLYFLEIKAMIFNRFPFIMRTPSLPNVDLSLLPLSLAPPFNTWSGQL